VCGKGLLKNERKVRGRTQKNSLAMALVEPTEDGYKDQKVLLPPRKGKPNKKGNKTRLLLELLRASIRGRYARKIKKNGS